MLKWPNSFGANIQEELQNILNAIEHSSFVAITNANGEITYVNDKFCEITKYSREELLGQSHNILNSGHHPDRFFTERWNRISNGNIWTGEIKNRAKDGSFYWVFSTIVPAIHENGDPPHYVSIQFDISEKKILEENMNKLKLDLDQAMIEREIREQFLSTLSHDLKTPLTIAKISSQIIEKKYSVTDKIKTLSIKITDNINRVDALITGLLDANRNRGHQKFPLEFVEFDMLDVVLETIENLTTIHGDRFRLEACGNLKGHWCLSGIKRILENLATNAIKYGDPDAPVEIKITENENQLILSINNKGNPISEIDQRIIFDYLQRTTSAELSNQNGWGLGLTIVKGMTEAHGGSIRVFSFPGDEGTTFTVTLPKDSWSFAQEKAKKSANLIIVNESENFLRLFRHMPEILAVLSGPQHIFEFVNEAYVEAFGFNATGRSICEIESDMFEHLEILDQVYSTGIPHKKLLSPLLVCGQIRYYNHTWVPRKNNVGKIIGILSISSEVSQGPKDNF
jgi:PAS domain S-box-containing protein